MVQLLRRRPCSEKLLAAPGSTATSTRTAARHLSAASRHEAALGRRSQRGEALDGDAAAAAVSARAAIAREKWTFGRRGPRGARSARAARAPGSYTTYLLPLTPSQRPLLKTTYLPTAPSSAALRSLRKDATLVWGAAKNF